MRKSRVLYGWCYRCLLCYAPPTRSQYLYDTIRIQPGVMQACQIGDTLILNAGRLAAGAAGGHWELTGAKDPTDCLRVKRLCPTAKEAPMSVCDTICSSRKRGRGDLRRVEKGPRLQEVPHADKWNALEPASHHGTLSRVDLVAEVGIFGEVINTRAETAIHETRGTSLLPAMYIPRYIQYIHTYSRIDASRSDRACC